MAFMSGISLPFLMLNYRLRHLVVSEKKLAPDQTDIGDSHKLEQLFGIDRPTIDSLVSEIWINSDNEGTIRGLKKIDITIK
jgi:hypothetical protein